MNRTEVKKIENYLVKLPDTAFDEIISFLDYLNYVNNVNSDNLFPDEKAAMEKFSRNPQTDSWEKAKTLYE